MSIQIPEKIHGCTELTTPNSRVNNSVFTRNETCRPKSYLDCQPSISSSDVTGHFTFSRNTLFISFFLIIMSQIVLSRSYWCTIAFLNTYTIVNFKAILTVIWGSWRGVPFTQSRLKTIQSRFILLYFVIYCFTIIPQHN